MKIAHYSVFAATPGGGKQFAIVEGVDDPVEMQRIAAESGQPLTGFILNAGAELVEARFFSPTKEKGASDSGALIIGEHLRQLGRVGDKLTVQMGEEGLEVFYKSEKWWSNQGNMQSSEIDLPKDELLEAMCIKEEWLSDFYPMGCGGADKVNLVIALSDTCLREFDSLKPNLKLLTEVSRATKTNGVILASEPIYYIKEKGTSEYTSIRFFAPAKGIDEDNAGSYTVASFCGYLARFENYQHQDIALMIDQGEAMGKPSTLYAISTIENNVAKNVQVGGKVEPLEVKQWP